MNVPEAVSQAYNAGLQLNLNREDIAFIAGIYTYVDISRNNSLESGDLDKVYTIVNEVSHGNQDSISQRCQSAVERLLKNQLLIRIDGGGISHRPIYDITQLGKAIVGFLSTHQKLTRQNLTIITSRIIGFLAEIRMSLETSGTGRFWEEKVQIPLDCIVGELLGAIENRQRGLDLEQKKVREQISNLLEKSWMNALESCKTLLETTSETLQELYRTLLAENTTIKQGLNEIYEQAESHEQFRVLESIDTIYHRLDQLDQWGKERVSSWSQYYRRVNDFLQSIVRFDPNRELSQNLKEQIRLFSDTPWYLKVIDPEVYRTIRELTLPSPKRRVVRTITDHQPVEETDDDGNLILDLMIEDTKSRLKNNQPLDLIELIKPYFKDYSLDQIYPHIGTLIDLLLKESNESPEGNPKWEKPLADLEFEMQNLSVQS